MWNFWMTFHWDLSRWHFTSTLNEVGLSSQRPESTLSEHLRLKAPLLGSISALDPPFPPTSPPGKGERRKEASKNSPKKERLEKPLRS